MQGLIPSKQLLQLNNIIIIENIKYFVFCSISFVETLKRVGVRVELILYNGKTHTDLFVQVSYHYNSSLNGPCNPTESVNCAGSSKRW